MKDEKEILMLKNRPSVEDAVARTIYDNIFYRDVRGTYRDWNTAAYQAPETQEGFAFHLCGSVANDIRKLFATSGLHAEAEAPLRDTVSTKG